MSFLAMFILVLICVKAEGDRFKVPNQEAMNDWSQWVVSTVGGNLGTYKSIADDCMKGPVNELQ